jgi:hypothetical protein
MVIQQYSRGIGRSTGVPVATVISVRIQNQRPITLQRGAQDSAPQVWVGCNRSQGRRRYGDLF